jgi:hypothetical protein
MKAKIGHSANIGRKISTTSAAKLKAVGAVCAYGDALIKATTATHNRKARIRRPTTETNAAPMPSVFLVASDCVGLFFVSVSFIVEPCVQVLSLGSDAMVRQVFSKV